jgi:hypothetical protein
VDETIPPMTTVASGRCTSDPGPTLKAIGTKPRDATSAVTNTARSRPSAPFTSASSSDWPSARSLRISPSITRPSRTATQEPAMTPTPAVI